MEGLGEADGNGSKVKVLWAYLQVAITSSSYDLKVVSKDVLLVLSGLSYNLLLVDT